MRTNIYLHPALVECPSTRVIKCIVTSIIQSSKFVQIISTESNSEKNTIIIPRKVFTNEIVLGACLFVEGEDRYKIHYGDIFIANSVTEQNPDISMFFLYAASNFHLLNKFSLQRLIDDDQNAFVQAVKRNDTKYFIDHGLTRYLTRKFLSFSQSKLRLENL